MMKIRIYSSTYTPNIEWVSSNTKSLKHIAAMATIGLGCTEILLPLLIFILLCNLWRRKDSMPTNWPLIGMLPALLRNVHRLHDFATEILRKSGCTFEFKGPWFTDMDFLITSDPASIHHIMSKNFLLYPKGDKFKKIFDVLGDGIFNADAELWESQRRISVSLFNHQRFQLFLEETTRWKVENGLIPVLDHVAKCGIEVDMQDLFHRFNFDNMCKLFVGFDPGCLSVEFPETPVADAFNEIEEAVLFRHVLPEPIWKLLKWLQIGEEKKLSKAYKTLYRFCQNCVALKREQLQKASSSPDEKDLLTAFIEEEQKQKQKQSDKYLSDVFLNFMVAGKDTTSAALAWFFWILTKNPSIEAKIYEEIKRTLLPKENEKWRFFNAEELSKLTYLHAALSETLRLFPSVPFQHKNPIQRDVLPSGHHVDPNTKILFSMYSMGRMEKIWGKDCLEFKPERWISERGGIKHEPSYKFMAFNAGPRNCLGKNIAFVQMKIIATSIICNYRVQIVEDHLVSPSRSIILHIKHGLKVKVSKRCI